MLQKNKVQPADLHDRAGPELLLEGVALPQGKCYRACPLPHLKCYP
jgi:hypothetical protein